MDFQKMMIVFLIVYIPVTIVLATYVHKQVDTLELQSNYKRKLIDSTYDAVNSYQINTMSGEIAVGEGNKRYVSAAISTFFNSLSNNLGISGAGKNELKSYIPAILFTNYDGYYIYSPTKMPVVAKDKDGLGKVQEDDIGVKYIKNDNTESNTIDSNTKIDYDYLLKPYVYYSATYTGNDYNVVISYSLDNYITVYGNITDSSGIQKTFTKSGYLIDYSKVDLSGNIYMEVSSGIRDLNNKEYTNLSVDDIEQYINNYSTQYSYGGKTNGSYVNGQFKRFQTGDEIIETTIDNYSSDINVFFDNVNIVDDYAKKYYLKAYFFSKWIYENLNMIKVKDIKADIDENSKLDDQIKLYFEENNDIIFDYDSTNKKPKENPESEKSIFDQHRNMVIRNSILYSLNSAVSTFSESNYGNIDYELPVLKESDWNLILNNIGMTVFMQGFPCGLKTFNDYTTVISTNNNQFISKDNLYFTTELGGPENPSSDIDYHRFDCEKLRPSGNSNYVADIGAEFKYDARTIDVRCTQVLNGYHYDSSTNKLSLDSTNWNDLTDENRKNIFYYDSSTGKYYNYDWSPVDYNNYTGGKSEFEGKLKDTNNSYYQIFDDYKGGEPMKVSLFDHKNTQCYDCIVSGSYTPVVEFNDDGEMVLSSNVYDSSNNKLTDEGEKIFTKLDVAESELSKRKETWYTYLAKYRNNIYKTNAYVNR